MANCENLFDFSVSRGPNQGLGFHVGFRRHADLVEMPDAGELLNELEGLPLPIEGAAPIFHGGVRFGSGGEIVAAISGPAGAGKTSTCLSLAAALAPMGCRTIFLSCEERAPDLHARLAESIPKYVARSTPLFRSVSLDELRDAGAHSNWFAAYGVRVSSNSSDGVPETKVDAAAEIRELLQELIENSVMFEPFQKRAGGVLPPFARPVVIVDGFHQLFRETAGIGPDAERSLRELIDYCRTLRAVFIFTVAAGDKGMERLDYLCDVVIELNKRGVDFPEEFTARIFKLLKARRQPAMVGAHPFHLTGPKSFRVKTNIASFAERAKSMRWFEPDTNSRIVLNDSGGQVLAVQNWGRILIIGKGSTGKAGLGLYALHRRPVPIEMLKSKPDDEARHAKVDFYELRTLVVSFLYQPTYYKNLAKRLRTINEEPANISLPNRALVDVISLYPGGLTPEDFLSKIENSMSAAELRGLPYTGVLIDGIHNVFVQYPVLEKATTFWPQLFTLFRRRSVTVVTTHTEFEVHSRYLAVDFEQAERRAAPLLSVLISAADYVFELAAIEKVSQPVQYLLAAKLMLGEDPPSGNLIWDRQGCRIAGWSAEQLTLPL